MTNKKFIMYWYAFPEDDRPIGATIFTHEDREFCGIKVPDVCIPETSVRKMTRLFHIS